VSADQLIELVDYGIVEPKGKQITQWRFSGVSIGRLRSAIRLQRDLGVNLPGVALALDLLEELNKLRQQVSRYQKLYNDLSE
jgi:chaperone modulatory protein CbpM